MALNEAWNVLKSGNMAPPSPPYDPDDPDNPENDDTAPTWGRKQPATAGPDYERLRRRREELDRYFKDKFRRG